MSRSTRVRALRGATTVPKDDAAAIAGATRELLEELLGRNGAAPEDLISIVFTATEDLGAAFPAAAARDLGLAAVPLLCARELAVAGAPERCVRVLIHLYTQRSTAELAHVYLHGARGLRDDLA